MGKIVDIENPPPHVGETKQEGPAAVKAAAGGGKGASAAAAAAAAAAVAVARDDSSVSVVSSNLGVRSVPTWIVATMIVFLGIGTAGAFMGIGISSARTDEYDQFDRRAKDLVTRLERAWDDYVTAASWIHGRCRNRDFSRFDFRQTYEYLINSGLDFQAAQFDPNITHDERPIAEEEARQFYAEFYPHINYRGFVGFNVETDTSLQPRDNASFYFPIHYMEPVIGNEAAIDLDYHASGSRKRTVMFCMDNGAPALTDRLRLVQEKTESAFGVVLMHPGYNLTTTQDEEGNDDIWPKDLASIVIRIPDLISRASGTQLESSAIYLYDDSDSGDTPVFLGAAEIIPNDQNNDQQKADLVFLPEIELEELRNDERDSLYYEQVIEAANKDWIVVVHSLDGTYRPDLVFVVLGGAIIVLASLCLASWVYTNTRRVDQFNRMRSEAESEKAALILDNARQATKAERELNDFIAHEVRNPVAAAMSACSFVKTAINEPEPLRTEETKQEIREDVGIIDNALRFVNDLLRNMLDMHRAANKQLKVHMAPTDILHDVLEPVHAMLPQRNSTKFRVEIDCPDGLVTVTDRLRLKQVCLNLGRNSVKFIDKGFIRLKAETINDEVHIYIEDSGPGIPLEKREMLFNKFQESLDSLSQGTGIGLFLCKNLVELMNGEIRLDKDYHSGVPGYPGTRFVVNLKQPPIDPQFIHEYEMLGGGDGSDEGLDGEGSNGSDDGPTQELPENLSVLFVDDDPILRKLFTRTVRTVAPNWTIREASNGETALHLVDTEKFDLIFMDMYMASVEKQLLGTETVKEIRSKGVKCRICGLSANDKESEFLEAGADVFTFKPLACEAKLLTQELCRVLYQGEE